MLFAFVSLLGTVAIMGKAGKVDLVREVKRIRRAARGRVHSVAWARLDNICSLALDLDTQVLDSYERSVVVNTLTSYLPDVLFPYLSLPKDYARNAVLSDGRSPLQSFCSQLDVLYAALGVISSRVMASRADKVFANEKFLVDKFGPNPLSVGSPLSSPVPVSLRSALISAVSEYLKNKKF